MASIINRFSNFLTKINAIKILKTKVFKNDCPGYIYVLEHPYDCMYKVGRTKRDPCVRARELGYKLLWYRFTKKNFRSEKIAHSYLSLFHEIIPSINGKGKTEIEWFRIPFCFLKFILSNVVQTNNNITKQNIIQLKEINGIGNILSISIYNYIRNNDISDIDDLLKIKWIGPKRLKSIKNYHNKN